MTSNVASLPGDPHVNEALARDHGVSADEYRRILEILGRTPTFTELGVFSVAWSEHCSYKSSRRHLKMLQPDRERVAVGAGENAGAIDVGDGWLAVFKIESHNHPSYVEPYQGAATGVGGIVRDIFTMGARPVANLNSLKFGSFSHPRTRYLLGGVVGGIGGYGNCVGIPTVGGEVMFDAAYNGNILVNAFCLGLVRKGEILSAKARGVGNPVIYVGSATGRDGIHGASLLASAEFAARSDHKRPTVQVGDPFAEKLLIEACLEAAKTGAIVAIQDMGAAGLTSSSSEMAGRSDGLGIDLELDRVPLREEDLTPYEMLLSESQERMLIVGERGRESELISVFEKWDLHAVVIGEITDTSRWRARYRGLTVADLPVKSLTDGAPLYDRPAAAPNRNWQHSMVVDRKPPQHPPGSDALRRLLDNPNLASKRWVFRQYDCLVRGNTVIGPGSDASVLRIKGTKRGLALKVDSNPRACSLNPYVGAIATVCESALNVACSGARPLAITNCLNYGNPQRPEIMWQFIRGVEGLRAAADALGVPVISGNVSFYNETEGRSIPPTPTIAVVGVIEAVSKRVTQHFKRAGDVIAIVRTNPPQLAASEYAAMFGGGTDWLAEIDLAREAALIDALVEASGRGLVSSAHDISDGGFAVALAECCFAPDSLTGAEVKLPESEGDLASILFGEGSSGVVVSAEAGAMTELRAIFARHALEARTIGTVTSAARLKIGSGISEDTNELRSIYESALTRRLGNVG
ncbi:MAG TPA: phosphoribosylformylglycinamidine synthase subunit PurL [Candidatus Binataceae bacterium]